MRNLNKATLDLIKSHEGLRLRAYQDSIGVWTIGYGHTRNVHPNDVIDEHTAEAYLLMDLEVAVDGVSSLVKVGVSDNSFGALVSFAFNLGLGNLSKSTLLKLVNQGKIKEAAEEFVKWNKAGGMVLAGLTKRREAEKALFLA